jgi:hypothetical protein
MANLQAIGFDGETIIYLLADGAGTNLDPFVSKFALTDGTITAIADAIPEFAFDGDRLLTSIDPAVTYSTELNEATLTAIVDAIPEFLFNDGSLKVFTGLNQPLTLTELQALTVKTEDQNLIAFGNLFVWEGDRLKIKTELNQPLTLAQLQELTVKTHEQVPLDVSTLSTKANQEATNTQIGARDETPPTSDTASSGLNGLLKRLAQRITSLIALLPSSLGTKTAANSFAVTLASDGVASGISTQIGEVQNSPTPNTVLDRLKAIVTALSNVTLASEAGFLCYRNTALSATPQSIKSSAGSLMAWNAININTVPVYLKFYNTASPTVGTTTPLLTILVPPSDGVTPGLFFQESCLIPVEVFNTAISVACVTGLADNSTTAPTTPIHISVRYK